MYIFALLILKQKTMKVFFITFLMFSLSINAQNLKNELLTFNVDYTNKEFIVRVGDIDENKSQVEVEIKCSKIILDYKKEKHFVEVFNIKQHVNNSNVFFGGKLIEGEYVITLTYVENGKKIKKIEKKLIKT
jgi:hypothetical protein